MAFGVTSPFLTHGRPALVSYQEATGYGPPSGALVIVGGRATPEILERFIELGGGASEGRFVIVPTADGNFDQNGYPRVYQHERVLASWQSLGVRNVSMLHTHSPRVADTEEFAAELGQATAVWFNGGRQRNLVDSYAGTRTLQEFHRVLERGGVIGGSSAGATIQGEYLVRSGPDGSHIVMTDEEEHHHGFEFLRRSAIDPHINTRNRWDDLTSVVQRYPHLLGIGLSEGTAIIVSGDRFEVLGESLVTVHDHTRAVSPGERPYLVLAHGDLYDMKARRIVKLGVGGVGSVWPSPAHW